jgi:hypothetical protein
MKPFHRPLFLFIILLLASTTPCVSAFAVSSVDVSPAGYQAAGTPMTIRFVIEFPWSGNETFPQKNELRMSTDLAEAYWVPVLVLEGKDTRMAVQSGTSLAISGWYLSYPSYQDVQLVVTLTGKIPENPSPRRNLFKVEEVDPAKNIVSTAQLAMSEAPLIPPATTATPTKKPTTIRTFTPIPTDTTQQSPAVTGAAVIAAAGAALLVMRRK